MELSTFAFIIGVIELVAGISFLLNGKETKKFFIELLRNEQFTRLCGIFLLVVCGLVLRDGFMVDNSVPGLLRLLAWLGFIKGVLYTWWPDHLSDMAETILDNVSLRPLISFVGIGLGAVLLWASTLV